MWEGISMTALSIAVVLVAINQIIHGIRLMELSKRQQQLEKCLRQLPK